MHSVGEGLMPECSVCEGLPAYASPSLAYYTHVTVDSDKLVNQQFAARSGSPHDDESSH